MGPLPDVKESTNLGYLIFAKLHDLQKYGCGNNQILENT